MALKEELPDDELDEAALEEAMRKLVVAPLPADVDDALTGLITATRRKRKRKTNG